MRTLLGVALLLFQVGMIIHARFHEARYFSWAPHDSQNEYWLEVTVHGTRLTPEEVAERYRIPAQGLDPESIQDVKDILSQYEETYGRDHPATILMEYRTNGGQKKVWRWPPQ